MPKTDFCVNDHDASDGSRATSPLLLGSGAVALACVLLPFFFYLTSNSGSLLAFANREGFEIAVRLGIATGGITMFVLGLVLRTVRRIGAPVVIVGALGSVICVLPLALSGFLDIPDAIAYPTGFVLGVSLDVLLLTWSLCIGAPTLNDLLVRCSACCVAAIVFDNLLSLLPRGIAGVIFAFVLAVSFLVPLMLSVKGSLSLPSYDPLSPVLEPVENSSDRFTKLTEMMHVIFNLILGLALFAILSNAQLYALSLAGPSITSFGIAGSALVVAVVARVLRDRPILPFANLLFFPATAGLLILFDAFPPQTVMAHVGSGGAFFYFSAIAVFAIAFLFAIVSKGEFSVLLVMGTSMCLLAFASLAGQMLVLIGMSEVKRGAMLLVVCTCFFLYMLISPAIQIWRSRRNEGQKPINRPILEEDFKERCALIARRHGLSRRESEVFFYIGRGYNASYIASALYISDSTARTHLNNIYHKLGVTSRMEILEMFEMFENEATP
jgi:DNA-binding CsgD family transcriptional regulator